VNLRSLQERNEILFYALLDRHIEEMLPIVYTPTVGDAVKNFYPAQKRDRTYMQAMEAVNSDGHKFDVFVTMPDGSTFDRVIMVAMQDLYSGKIIAHRIGVSEHKHLVRLVIGDMLKEHGIPERCYLDNGRAFASKDISGGTKNRYRYKVRDEEPDGLLTLMGVKTIFVTPYSGQSKPIERAFRDMCDDIAKTPEFAGAWTGNHIDNKPANYKGKSIPFETLQAVVAREITLHNARLDRTSDVCKGRSFDQAFTESLAAQLVPPARPSAVQERFWLLAAEGITTKPNGMVHLLGNRYWIDELANHGKRKVVVRFDPQNLLKPVHVYDEKGRHICEAPNFGIAKFASSDDARDHNSKRKAFMKANKAVLDAERDMSLDQMVGLYSNAANKAAAAIEGKSAPEPQAPVPSNVHRLATNAARKPDPSRIEDVAVWDDDADIAFGRALAHQARFQPGHTADLIPIPKPRKDTGE